MTACFLYCFLCHDYRQCQMTVIEVKENGAIRTKMLSCDSPFFDAMKKAAHMDGDYFANRSAWCIIRRVPS